MKNIYVCLDNLRSLYNIGAIFRTCSFFGIYNLILLGYSGKDYDEHENVILHKEILKTSLGSENDLKLYFFDEPKELFDFSKKMGLKLITLEQTPSAVNIIEWKPEKDLVIVFGNEKAGVRDVILERSENTLQINRKGKHNSLNVTTTAGIVLNHIKNSI
jgi:tRNA G18 (ribose-2'-O)-methylase SpoU